MKLIFIIFFLIFGYAGIAQNDSIPSNIDSLGVVEVLPEPIKKGNNINFKFFTDFNKQVSLQLFNEKGDLLSTTNIEVFSDRGLALTTRSFEPGTYYLCLKLKTKNMVKKVTVVP